MNIGAIIKLNRIQQNLTQEELAEGIISVSYLSKIENGKIEPNEEIIKLLCTRLNVDIKPESSDEIHALCQHWFEVILHSSVYYNLDEYKTEYAKVQKALSSSTNIELKLMVNIHLIRYYLKIGEIQTAKKHVEELKSVYKTFTNLQKYYWNKFTGNYFYAINEFNESIHCYVTAEDLFNSNDQSIEELADLKYCLALSYVRMRINSLSLHTSLKALELYRNIYNMARCAECHIVIGISYRRINNYDLAIENYSLAKKLAEQLDNTELIQLSNQNLGFLYSLKGDTKRASSLLDVTVDNVDAEVRERLTAIISMIEMQFRHENYQELRAVIKKGVTLIKETPEENLEMFSLEIDMYSYYIEEDYTLFENHVTSKLIPFLEKNKDYGKLIMVTRLLASYFEENRKYKYSTKYYKLVSKYYKNITEL